MQKYSLDGEWKLRVIGENVYDLPPEWIGAKVPGSVCGAYLEKGMIPDPYYRQNELDATKLFENDFEYARTFAVDESGLRADSLLLVFEGIDTLADIYLNGALLDSTSNMHLRYEYEIKDKVREGENELRVYLHSPVRYIREENEKVYTGGSNEAMEGYPHLRKAHCMFGWDWGPRIPDAGIFRPVYLLAADGAMLGDVYVEQQHEKDRVTLHFKTCVYPLDGKREWRAPDDLYVRITVTSPDGETIEAHDNCAVIEKPKLWWPNGYGEQPLYGVRAELMVKSKEGTFSAADVWERKIGLRTMTVNTKKDEWGEKFAHRINGLDIFAMGADYIPEDNLFGRVNRERTRRLLEAAARAHHNTIRVWGGGYYPDEYFYDICDELGLVVWQDFMFACSSYELDDAFERSITAEVAQTVKRLRSHACLGLWCGNNEMETQTLDGCWKPSEKQKCDYIKIFEYIIPRLVKKLDPGTFYWPSSPSSGGSFDNPWDENRGDVHYWDVWHGNKPFTEYRKFRFRYLSEFGFQSFPCLKTVESFTEPGDRNIFSRVMEMHQRNRAANGKILEYLAQTYLYPKDFDSLLYASQLLQAEAIRYGVEHFRRHRGRCMGAVVWQLNDIWPVASWAGIDYFGRWKALHYAEKRMFAPVLISCEETGELSERPHCIAERKGAIEVSARLHVANETWDTVQGEVQWELRTPDARIVKAGGGQVQVGPFAGAWLDKVDFSGYDELSHYISYRFLRDGQTVSEGTTLFTAPKHFAFEDPRLTVQAGDGKVTVRAAGYARSVEIVPLDGDAVFSDNYFDLNGDAKTVLVEEGDATRFAVRSVWDMAH